MFSFENTRALHFLEKWKHIVIHAYRALSTHGWMDAVLNLLLPVLYSIEKYDVRQGRVEGETESERRERGERHLFPAETKE